MRPAGVSILEFVPPKWPTHIHFLKCTTAVCSVLAFNRNGGPAYYNTNRKFSLLISSSTPQSRVTLRAGQVAGESIPNY